MNRNIIRLVTGIASLVLIIAGVAFINSRKVDVWPEQVKNIQWIEIAMPQVGGITLADGTDLDITWVDENKENGDLTHEVVLGTSDGPISCEFRSYRGRIHGLGGAGKGSPLDCVMHYMRDPFVRVYEQGLSDVGKTNLDLSAQKAVFFQVDSSENNIYILRGNGGMKIVSFVSTSRGIAVNINGLPICSFNLSLTTGSMSNISLDHCDSGYFQNQDGSYGERVLDIEVLGDFDKLYVLR